MEEVFVYYCPECDGQIEVPIDAMIGEVFECSNCGAELEVVETEPDIIMEFYEEEEK